MSQLSASSAPWGPDREQTAIEVAAARVSQGAALADRPVNVDKPPMPLLFEDRVAVEDAMLGAGVLPASTEHVVGEIFHRPPNVPPIILREEGLGNWGESMNDPALERRARLDPARYTDSQDADDSMRAAVAEYVRSVSPMLAVGEVPDREYEIVADVVSTVTRKDYDQDFGLAAQAELRASGFGRLRGGPATIEEVVSSIGDVPKAPVSRDSLEQISVELANGGMSIDDLRSLVGTYARYEADEVEPMLLMAQGRPAAEQAMADVLPSGVPIAAQYGQPFSNEEDPNLVPPEFLARVLDASRDQVLNIEDPPDYHPAESDYQDVTGQTGYDEETLRAFGRVRPRRFRGSIASGGGATAAAGPTGTAAVSAGPTGTAAPATVYQAGPTGVAASTPSVDQARPAADSAKAEFDAAIEAATNEMGALISLCSSVPAGEQRYKAATQGLGMLNGIALAYGKIITGIAQKYSASVPGATLGGLAGAASFSLSAIAVQTQKKLEEIAIANMPTQVAAAGPGGGDSSTLLITNEPEGGVPASLISETSSPASGAGATTPVYTSPDVTGYAAGPTAADIAGATVTLPGDTTQTGEGVVTLPETEIVATVKRPLWPSIVGSVLATAGLWVLMSGKKGSK